MDALQGLFAALCCGPESARVAHAVGVEVARRHRDILTDEEHTGIAPVRVAAEEAVPVRPPVGGAHQYGRVGKGAETRERGVVEGQAGPPSGQPDGFVPAMEKGVVTVSRPGPKHRRPGQTRGVQRENEKVA